MNDCELSSLLLVALLGFAPGMALGAFLASRESEPAAESPTHQTIQVPFQTYGAKDFRFHIITLPTGERLLAHLGCIVPLPPLPVTLENSR